MRYYDDGDLTEGLAIATKPYPFELLLGYWHAVSTSNDGERSTVDYDNPDSPALFRIELEYIEGHKQARPEVKRPRGKKRQRDSEARAHDDLQVSLNYRDWNLEFTGQFATEDPATVLYLSSNDAPDAGDVDNEATLAFGSVLDDRGYPFLRIMLSACEASSGTDDMSSIEIVAKKTDTTEVHKLELSKNERLRLGFAVRSDGQFEDLVGSGEPKDTYEELARKLGEHSAESARIAQQMQRKRAALDEQLKEAVDAGRRVKSIYNGQRLSLPARGSGQQGPVGDRQSLGSAVPSSQQQQQQQQRQQTQQQQQQQRLISSAPRPSTAPRSSVPMRMRPGHIPVHDDDSTPIIPGSATPGTNNKGKKHCSSCNRTVSLNHGAWIKHINSKKHAEQVKAVGGGLTGGSGGSARKQTPASAKPRLSNGTGPSASPSTAAAAPGGRLPTKPATPKMPRGYALVGIDDDDIDNPNDDDLVRDRSPHQNINNLDFEDETSISSSSSAGLETPPSAGQTPNTTTPVIRRRRRRISSAPKGETQWCADCECQISVKNWNIHTRSNKHQMNALMGKGEGEGEPLGKRARIGV